MYRKNKIAVIIPAYNEEKLISKTITTIPDFVDQIIVVDDNSNDNTFKLVRSLQKKYSKKVFLIKHDKNLGVGGAIKTGYKKSLELKMDITVVMAGDAQMDPNEVNKLLDPIIEKKADYTKGNRLTHKDKMKMPKSRAFGNGMLTFLTKISSGYWNIIDPQNGYTAISKNALESIDIDGVYSGYGYPNDLLIKLNLARLKVADVEMPPIYGTEKSGIKVGRYSLRLTGLLIKGFFKRIWREYGGVNFHPLFLFYLIGLILFPLGLIFGVFVLYYRITTGDYSTGTVILTALFLIMGLQSLIFAMLFDMESNKKLFGED
ncbi:MAG: glycosyltransferase family 2 protein [Thermoplasmatales archaeon]|nr:glycosyltransferase family 2 protein [Thermoplasmatales archaeon]